jgi:glucose-6-phosphate isomerase
MKAAGFSYSLGAYHDAVITTLGALSQSNILTRIRAKDYTVWKPAPDEIVNRLGWLDAPQQTRKGLNSLRSTIDLLISGMRDAVLLGMGGSTLAAEVFSKIFGGRKSYPRLHILDTTDPATIASVTKNLKLEKTLFLVSSKSGTTLETISLFKYFYNLSQNKLGNKVGNHFLIITDAGTPLVETAAKLSLRNVFLNDSDIGGRYSALTLPGIIPTLIIGADAEKLLQKAEAASQKEFLSGKLDDTGCALGAVIGTLAGKGRDKLTFIFPPLWKPFGVWLEQLIAESTGKEGGGIIPVLDEPLAAPDRYLQDRVFIFFTDGNHKRTKKISAFTAAGHPVIAIELQDAYDVGSQMFIWEMATAVAGHVLGINPFDQPDVETTKVHTRRLMAFLNEGKKLPAENASASTAGYSLYGGSRNSSAESAINDFLQGVDANYISLQIYLSPTKEVQKELQNLRAAIFSRFRLPVTFGYGPRYLHSTGQLHKGGAGGGVFIQITGDDSPDIEIPEHFGITGSVLSFGTLKALQAAADRQALMELGRKVIRIHLHKNIAADLKAIAGTITGNH